MALFEREDGEGAPMRDDEQMHAAVISTKLLFITWCRATGDSVDAIAQMVLVEDEAFAVAGMDGRLH